MFIGFAWILTIIGILSDDFAINEIGHIAFAVSLGFMICFAQSKLLVCVGIITLLITLLYRWFYGQCAYHTVGYPNKHEENLRKDVQRKLPSWEQLAILLLPLGLIRLVILHKRYLK